jgi:hypothetical protein
MNSRQKKLKGSLFERECAAIFRANLWKECYVSNYLGSNLLDNLGIDLAGTGNFNIQCKHLERSIPVHKILERMPQTKATNLVIHKRGHGITVTMILNDFIKLAKNAKS